MKLVQRMATVPGQRTIIVISPGFFTIDPLFFLADAQPGPKVKRLVPRARGLNLHPPAAGIGGNPQVPAFPSVHHLDTMHMNRC
jgi:hypothetical protein